MRKSFEHTLVGTYRDIALEQIKQDEKEDLAPEDQAELERVLNWHARNKAENKFANRHERRLTPGPHILESDIPAIAVNEKEIVGLQKKKQQIVAALEQERRNLNNPEYRPERTPGSKEVRYHEGSGSYFIFSESGERDPITLGEIITDFEFGQEYYLDPDSVPRVIRKKYLLEKAKSQLRDLLDDQIILDEWGRGNALIAEAVDIKRDIMRTDKFERGAPAGFLAEVMVTNFLDKLAIDFDLDLQFVKVDVYEDVAHKIDFIVKRSQHHRGVKAVAQEEGVTPEVVGIQFTINQMPEVLSKKNQQVREMRRKLGEEIQLDDIVLVSLPIRNLNDAYTEWLEQRRPAGGPDKLWDRSVKIAIIEGVLHGIVSPEEVESLKDQIE